MVFWEVEMRHFLWVSIIIISSVISCFLEKAGLEIKSIYWLLGFITGELVIVFSRGR